MSLLQTSRDSRAIWRLQSQKEFETAVPYSGSSQLRPTKV
jgi:hypothetical protein